MIEQYETAVLKPSQRTNEAQERQRLLDELNKAKTPWKMLRIFRRLKKLEPHSFETPERR